MIGSIINHVMSGNQALKPEIGMGATICMWSDRHAATVTMVAKKTIWVVEDISTRVDNNGMSESQEYSYAPNPNGTPQIFTLRKNGRWVRLGESMHNGLSLALGVRRTYHDFSF